MRIYESNNLKAGKRKIKMFDDGDLTAMKHLRDAFNPKGNLSPAKMIPTAGGCGMEQKHPGRRAAL